MKGLWQPPSLSEMQTLLPGYQFLALLGRGGMGAVFKATQISLHRTVAIKVLPKDSMSDLDANFGARFRQEARTMAKLSHPNIVSVFETGEAGGLLYIVMEFVDGTDVARLIEREGKIVSGRIVRLLTQVCHALQYAHQRGVVHRDIKPANLLLTQDGILKIADFGLAKHLDDAALALTKVDVTIGTPDFLAPEAWTPNTPLDSRADLYAVGVTLYQMLTGEIPRGLWEMPSARAGTDVRFDAIIERAMQPKPEARYQSAAELGRDLERIQMEPNPAQGRPQRNKEPGSEQSPPPLVAAAHARGRLLISFAAVALAGIAGIVTLAWPSLRTYWTRFGQGTLAPHFSVHPSATVREAALWLLREKATFKIVSQNREIEVKSELDIPQGDFQIVYLWFDRWASSPPQPPPPEDEFEILRAVKTLRFAFLRLPGLSNRAFAFLSGNPDLQTLHIACPENVTDEVLVHLAGLRKLETVVISHSPQFTGEGLARCAWLANVQEVDFLYAALSDDVAGILAACPRLKLVKLEGTRLTHEGLRALSAARRISQLNVGGCPNLTEDDLIDILPKFGRLRRLELPYAAIGDEAVEALAALTNLTEIRLNGTKITDEGLAKLSPLPRLELVDVSHTSVTPEGIASFQKTHPGCRFNQ